VQSNENSVHIAWTAILLHTRELLQPLYQWQASFDPLARKYEQSKTKGLTKGEMRKLKVLIAKQITDDEKVILAGLDPTFTIENIDKSEFTLRHFQKKLAENASRFQSKRYTPDARILTHLRIRAQEFKVLPPAFMRKRQPEKGKDQNKRQRSNIQQNRSRTYQTYVQQPVAPTTGTTNASSSAFPNPAISKGKHKGKGKLFVKGNRSSPQTPSTGLLGKGSQGKGFMNTFSKGKSMPISKGKGDKGKGSRFPQASSSSFPRLQCKFCHMHGHLEQNCRKRFALHNSAPYQQAKSTFTPRQQLIVDQLEDTLFAPNVCSWCLACACTPESCYPPEDPEFYTEVTHLFQSTLLPYVQNAKLGLPIDDSAPLMPHHFAFEETEWGHHEDQNTEQHSYDDQYEEDNVVLQYDSCEWTQDNNEQYAFDYCDVEGPGEEQMHQQIAESLNMNAEIRSEGHIMDSDNYVEEDHDLFGVEEALEKDQ
jgi:hypothetical protein